MNLKRNVTRALAGLALVTGNLAVAQTTLLNASYDVAREFYKDYNAAFVAHYKKTTGKDIKIDQAHGGSSAQARAVNDGLDADVVTMNTTPTSSFWPARASWPRTGPSASPAMPRPQHQPCCFSRAKAILNTSRTGTT